jgi:DNA replicative helicase MCM subunit Mcm2 (Cdc46/Mcm family)
MNMRTQKIETRVEDGKPIWNYTCTKCGHEFERNTFNSKKYKKCVFCRHGEPTSAFGKYYRQNIMSDKPTKGFKKWQKWNNEHANAHYVPVAER